MSRPASDQKSPWLVPVICLFLGGLVWIVYGQTITHEFVNFDDGSYVYGNGAVRSGISIRGVDWAFTHVHSQNWHPFTTISHMIDCRLFGLKPGSHHAVNVFLHTINVLLLFLVLRQMTERIWPGAFVAAIFAVHPLHVESVAWVAERKDVLSGLFFLLTLWAYLRYARAPSVARYLLVAGFFVCGLMSKPMLVTVPVVLLLLDYWPLRRVSDFRRMFFEKIPLFVLSAASCVATIMAQRQAIGSVEQLPLKWRLSNALISYVIYVGQTIWPAKLAIFYAHPEGSLRIWQLLLAGGFLIAVTWAAIAVRKRRPWILTGWLWYLVMLLPVIGIFQVGLQGHADRYMYLPQIGLCLLIIWSISDFAGARLSRQLAAAVGVLVVFALTVVAWRQTSFWKNSESLWTHAIAVTSNNDVACAGLGGVLLDQGKIDEAIENFSHALRVRPDNAEAHRELGNALQRKGNLVDAVAHWNRSVELQPEDVATRDALGAVLVQQGRLGDAIAQWHESMRFDPDDGNALNNLAWVWATAPEASARDGSKAVEFAERAVQLAGPDNPMVFRTLAAAYAEVGRFSDAAATAKRAAQIAANQNNFALVDELQRNVALYEANSPLRDRTLSNGAP